MKRKIPFPYIVAAMLLVSVGLMTTGCGVSEESLAVKEETVKETVAETVKDETPETDKGETAETGVSAANVADGETAAQDALTALRQQMDEPELFAVSYLGRMESAWDGDGEALSQKLFSERISNLPFLEEIPQERIIGFYGDLYCIVPKDVDSGLTVNRMTWVMDGEEWKAETEQELYHSKTGEPILLFCNEEGYLDSTDVEIRVTDAEGREIRWEPVFLDGVFVRLPLDGKGHYAARDLTDYGPDEPEDYRAWIEECGWYVPAVDELPDTEWTAQTFPPDDTPAAYTLSLYGNADGYSGYAGEALFSWCYDGDWEMQEEYNGWWSFVEKDGKAFLHLELGRVGGIQYQDGEEWKTICNDYPVLRHQETGQLLMLRGDGEDLLPLWKENQLYVILCVPYG